MSDKKRYDPPQWVAILCAIAPSIIGAVTVIAVCTDWFQRFSQWFADVQWGNAVVLFGQAILILLGLLLSGVILALVVDFLFNAWLGMSKAFGILRCWRLTFWETVRTALFAGIGFIVNTLLLCWSFALAVYNQMNNGDVLLGVIAISLGIGLSVYALHSVFIAREVSPDDYNDYAAKKILFPAHMKTYAALCEAASECCHGRELAPLPFGCDGYGLYGFQLPADSDIVDSWIQDNLTELKEYAAYHPDFEKALDERLEKINKETAR